jgi:hypothetical protein
MYTYYSIPSFSISYDAPASPSNDEKNCENVPTQKYRNPSEYALYLPSSETGLEIVVLRERYNC